MPKLWWPHSLEDRHYLVEVAFSHFYCSYGKLLLFGKVEHLRCLICAHYSLLRAWLLNVRDVYVAGSAVQALLWRRAWVNALQGRRGQAALQAGRQESRGLKRGFPAFPSMEIPPTGRRKESAAHRAGGRGVYRALGENKCTEMSKSQRERGRMWRRRRGKMRKLSSSVLTAENAAVFSNLAFL